MGRCAVVDDKYTVINIIVADADVDVLAGYMLVNVPDDVRAEVGNIYDGVTFNLNEVQQVEADAELARVLALSECEE